MVSYNVAMINIRIKIILNILFLKYDSCFLNIEQYDSFNAESNVKGVAKLPCNKVYFSTREYSEGPTLVMWFKYGIDSPIYSVDFRHVKEGTHWSSENTFGPRACYNIERSVLSIEPVQEEDEGQYKCRMDFEKSPTINYVVNLFVIVPPTAVSITTTGGVTISTAVLDPIMEDQPLQLVCTAYGGKPAPRVRWRQNEILVDNQSEILLNNQINNILHLDRVERHHHGSILKCEAVNGQNLNIISKIVAMNLYLRPLGVRLLGNNELFRAGQEYRIICETYGSRPPGNVTWMLKGTKVHSSFVETLVSSDKNVTTSILKFHPKFHHHRSKLTCKVTNNNIAGSTLTASWNLRVIYAPLVRIEIGRNLNRTTIREGNDVYFDCIIDANPVTTKIYWTHNKEILVMSSLGVIISNQTLVLQNITKQAAGNYCCIAANMEGETQSELFYLDVKYKPVCSKHQQLIYGAIRHEHIEIVCNVDANPLVESYIWKFNNSLIYTKDVPTFTTAMNHSVAMYQPKNEFEYGTLLCWGKNELGLQPIPCVYHIIPAGKPDTPHHCTVSSNVSDHLIYIRCKNGFDGGLPQEFVCEVFTNESGQLKWNITNRMFPEFSISGLENYLDYTIIIYASNGRGRSSNRVELLVKSSVETPAKHTRMAGIKNKFFTLLWTVVLSMILIFLLCLLLILIIKLVEARRKHNIRQQQKKQFTGASVHSDDDCNPDIIPQIEEIYISCSRRPSATSYTHLKHIAAEVTASYNLGSNQLLKIVNYSTVPTDLSPAKSQCSSIVQWTDTRLFNENKLHVINAISNDLADSVSNLYTSMHKESAV